MKTLLVLYWLTRAQGYPDVPPELADMMVKFQTERACTRALEALAQTTSMDGDYTLYGECQNDGDLSR